jgi:hypothetical protein
MRVPGINSVSSASLCSTISWSAVRLALIRTLIYSRTPPPIHLMQILAPLADINASLSDQH